MSSIQQKQPCRSIMNQHSLKHLRQLTLTDGSERVLNNSAVERVLQLESIKGKDINFDDIASDVTGVYPQVMLDGDIDKGAWSCGMVAGLINDIPTCKALIDSIMIEAEEIINARLGGMLRGIS